MTHIVGHSILYMGMTKRFVYYLNYAMTAHPVEFEDCRLSGYSPIPFSKWAITKAENMRNTEDLSLDPPLDPPLITMQRYARDTDLERLKY